MVENNALNAGGIYSGKAVLVQKSQVSFNQANFDGGGIFANSVTIQNSAIQDNKAANSFGGGVYALIKVEVKDSSVIKGNTANILGGGIYTQNVIIQDSTVSENQANDSGGGIYATNTVTLTNATVSKNTAGKDGGGIGAGGTVTLTNSEVSSNKATLFNGGGIFSTGDVILTNNSKVSGNTAGQDGGGIWANKNVTLNNSQVLNNEAKNGSGGGIHASGDVTLNNNSLVSENNRAKVNGGGILSFNGNVILNDSEVSFNTAGQFGGGINAKGDVNIIDSVVVKNNALNAGGIYSGKAVLVQKSQVSSNQANFDGGGIFANSVTIQNSAIQDNKAANSFGGGVYALIKVEVKDSSVIKGNTANILGGGIYTQNVIIQDSTVSENQANDSGGGIYATNTVTLTNSTVSKNTAGKDGGGIYVGGGGQISNSDITRNDAQTGSGGGIFNGSGSDLTISASKITENEAGLSGAGIANDGTLTLTDVTVAGNGQVFGVNNGGGLANKPGATATIENSTFSGNVANNGGGIDNQGTLTATNSTLGENEANLEGGGLRNLGGTATLNNVTIVGNQVLATGVNGGGGIFNDAGSTLTISNSIVAGNTDVNGVTKNEVVNQGTFTIAGPNLVGQNGNLGGFPADPSNIVVPGAVIGVQVAPLANNGGFTETFALLPGSLAINASGAGATTSDQRGVAAVGIRDIGAFEFVPPVVLVPPNDGSPETTSDGGFQPKLQVDGEGDILLLLKELKVLAVEPSLSPLETLTSWDQSFALQFGLSGLEPENAIGSIQEMQEVLKEAEEQGRGRTAILYWWMRDGNLTLGLFLPKGIAQQTVFVKTVNVNQKEIDQTITDFVSVIKDFRQRDTFNYRPAAQKLYSWLLAPIEPILENYQIETLMLVPDEKFRAIPYRALWNGNQYLIERYRITQIPSIKLVNLDLTSQSLTRNLIAMGASEFNGRKPNLPAVPVELQQVAEINQGQMRLNQEFTVETVINAWRTAPVRAVHLATHAEFSATKNYIEFWDGAVSFQTLRQLLPTSRSELVVLSACRTAIGDTYAELGFAGLAVRLGAKRAVASLWYVEDEGTLALMNDFYRRLQTSATVPIASDALRQAQINMIRGNIRFQDRRLMGPGYTIALPPTLRQGERSLSHPYFWAGFNMIGNPW